YDHTAHAHHYNFLNPFSTRGGYSSFSAPPGYNVIEVYPFNNPLRITFWTPSESTRSIKINFTWSYLAIQISEQKENKLKVACDWDEESLNHYDTNVNFTASVRQRNMIFGFNAPLRGIVDMLGHRFVTIVAICTTQDSVTRLLHIGVELSPSPSDILHRQRLRHQQQQ
ncbi:16288_t:CDS:2, partial [Entrophospora sp. SA101]